MNSRCDSCSGSLCPGDLSCGACGTPCDPDQAFGFLVKRPMQRGDTLELEYDLVDATGAPMDLSAPGTKVWFTVKYYLRDPDAQAVAQPTLANGGILSRDVLTSGRIRVTVAASATLGIMDGATKLYYDLQVLDHLGRVSTIEKGLLVVDPDVTRSIA